MPASKLELPVENPSALIRARIREKRIFEARFLYRQLGTEIRDKEKTALEGELSGSLEQVKKLQQQAREYAAQGQNDLAAKLYLDIEQIAIDVPGLAEEKKTLAGAEALVARITGKTPEGRKAPAEVSGAPAVSEGQVVAPVAQIVPDAEVVQVAPAVPQKPVRTNGLQQRLQQIPYPWLVAVGIGCLVALLFLLSSPQHQPAAPSPSLPAPSKQTISIRPLEASSSMVPGQPSPESDPDRAAVETAPEPSPVLQMNSLQIIKTVPR
jgi:hypothetical protein